MSSNRLWLLPGFFVTTLVVLSLTSLIASLFQKEPEIWIHLTQYVLPEALKGTVLLILGVLLGASVLGVSLAWLCSQYDFWAKNFFKQFLILPLTVPGYVFAFVYIGTLDYSSPLQEFVRQNWFIDLNQYFSIKSYPGLIFVFSLSLYPYVYLLMTTAFNKLSQSWGQVGQSLGLKPWQIFYHIRLPMAWPSLVAGLTLVAMEVLADFGTVSIFNYATLTTSIYKVWFGMHSWIGAAQLSTVLVVLAFLLFSFKQYQGRKKKYEDSSLGQPVTCYKLTGGGQVLAVGYILLVLLLAFILPITQLIIWFWPQHSQLSYRLLADVSHSLYFATISTGLLLLVSFLVLWSQRRIKAHWYQQISSFGSIGYALPGTVLAVGVMSLLHYFKLPSWLMSGTLIVFIGYLIRFMAVSQQSLQASFASLPESMDLVLNQLTGQLRRYWWEIYLPLLKNGFITASILIFVEVIKEMPITLMTRPFGWDTLAVRIFEYTSEGEWELAAGPALIIILVSFIPSLWLQKSWMK